MQYLLGKTLQEITEITHNISAAPFVAKQICQWVYAKQINSMADMRNISAKTQDILSKQYSVGRIPYIKEVISRDGTRKYLFEYDGGVFVEAVLLFDKTRVTLCISTQAGCSMNCKFCATGKQGKLRNLTSHEIINIFTVLNVRCADIKLPDYPIERPLKIDNIVFMGMGEPLDNYDEVKKTLDILTAPWGFALSPHRITVSTAGYMPYMKQLLDDTEVDVAISLHNAVSEQRKDIMPIEKAYPISETIRLLRLYDWTGQRHLTFEYIVFDSLNDSAMHVNAICKLLNGLPCRINLIPFNTVPDTPFVGADRNKMNNFASLLKSKGFNVTIRQSKGFDISAACGLLSTKQLSEKKN